jgi:hypothetical protein
MAFFRKVLVVLSAFAFGMLIGCTNNAISVDENYSGGTCAALLKIAAGANSPFSRIADSASLTISASDMDNFVRVLTITDSTVEGTVTGIPAGKGRLFTVSVFDSLDSLQYKGTATADLPRGSTVNVPITLYRVGANAVINGNIIETGTISSNGLVAYWPFINGSTADLSGNSNNGFGIGLVKCADRFDAPDAALQFNGTSTYDSIPYNSFLVPHSLTVSVWMYITAYPPLGKVWPLIHDGDPDVESTMWEFDICRSLAGEPFIAFVYKGTNRRENTYAAVDVPNDTALKLNKWIHVVNMYDSASTRISTYINGLLIRSKTGAPAGTISSTKPFQIGKLVSGTSNHSNFEGRLDDYRIYNRALSETEILDLYHENGWTGN